MKPKPFGYPKELITLSDHILARRLDKGMLQREAAKEIGISTSTLENWERKQSSPRTRYIPLLTKFLGYSLIKYHPNGGWRQTLLNDRMQRGMLQYKYRVTRHELCQTCWN